MPAFTEVCLARIMSRLSYDNTGNVYNVSKILTVNATLDFEAYKAYSPLYLPYVPFWRSYSTVVKLTPSLPLHFPLELRSQSLTG